MRLKRIVEDAFGFVRVRGEISGWKRASSGHCYLCLKDDKAVIDGVIWKGAAAALPLLYILVAARAIEAVVGPASTIVEMSGHRARP